MRCTGAQAAIDHYEAVNDWLFYIDKVLNPVGSYTSCVMAVVDKLVR
jgi:hypothetical protein